MGCGSYSVVCDGGSMTLVDSHFSIFWKLKCGAYCTITIKITLMHAEGKPFSCSQHVLGLSTCIHYIVK